MMTASKRSPWKSEARKQYMREWRASHKKEVKLYLATWNIINSVATKSQRAEYRKTNADRIKDQQVEYRLTRKEKKRQYDVAYRLKNAEKLRSIRKVNRPKLSKYMVSYYIANVEKLKIQNKIRHAKWYLNNTDRCCSDSRARKAAKRGLTPAWNDYDVMRAIYTKSRRLTRETGVSWSVDHVIPMKSYWVCGLHVHTNLEPMTVSQNSGKHNKWWPDMFDEVRGLKPTPEMF